MVLHNACKTTATDPIGGSKEAFMEQCHTELANADFDDNDRINACVCNHDYLFEKYGDNIYREDHKMEFEDSVEKLQCYMDVYKQKAHRMEELGV